MEAGKAGAVPDIPTPATQLQLRTQEDQQSNLSKKKKNTNLHLVLLMLKQLDFLIRGLLPNFSYVSQSVSPVQSVLAGVFLQALRVLLSKPSPKSLQSFPSPR